MDSQKSRGLKGLKSPFEPLFSVPIENPKNLLMPDPGIALQSDA